MRLLVTRPEEDAQPLRAALKAQGYDVINAPLLDIQYLSGPDLDVVGVQAILFTSANGVRAFAKRCKERSVLALCVGDATAGEALAADFSTVKSANGDVQTLTKLVKASCDAHAGPLLHPAGTDIAGDLGQGLTAAGFTYRREVLYTAIKATDLPAEVLQSLRTGGFGGVLLYSPRTAQAFVKLVSKASQIEALKNMTAYCLSPAVADEISNLRWQDVKIADKPNQDALLALL